MSANSCPTSTMARAATCRNMLQGGVRLFHHCKQAQAIHLAANGNEWIVYASLFAMAENVRNPSGRTTRSARALKVRSRRRRSFPRLDCRRCNKFGYVPQYTLFDAALHYELAISIRASKGSISRSTDKPCSTRYNTHRALGAKSMFLRAPTTVLGLADVSMVVTRIANGFSIYSLFAIPIRFDVERETRR